MFDRDDMTNEEDERLRKLFQARQPTQDRQEEAFVQGVMNRVEHLRARRRIVLEGATTVGVCAAMFSLRPVLELQLHVPFVPAVGPVAPILLVAGVAMALWAACLVAEG